MDFLTNAHLSPDARAHLLKWKGRWDLTNYAGGGAPPLLPEELNNYAPKEPDADWLRLIERMNQYIHVEDGGHIAKIIRALIYGWKLCEKVDRSKFALKALDQWSRAAGLCLNAVESGSPLWVRWTGFEQAWVSIPFQPKNV